MPNLKDKCAIVGIGETAVGKLATMSSTGIQLEAIRLALKDAQLRSADIDSLLAIQPADDPRRSCTLSIAQAALQQCLSCKQFRYPPRSLCPKYHSPEVQWTPISGRGKVYVTIVMCRSYGHAWEHDVPYNIWLIDPEEGVRMWSNVIRFPAEDVKIGDCVKSLTKM